MGLGNHQIAQKDIQLMQINCPILDKLVKSGLGSQSNPKWTELSN